MSNVIEIKPPLDKDRIEDFLGISENKLTQKQKEIVDAITNVLCGGAGNAEDVLIFQPVEEDPNQ